MQMFSANIALLLWLSLSFVVFLSPTCLHSDCKQGDVWSLNVMRSCKLYLLDIIIYSSSSYKVIIFSTNICNICEYYCVSKLHVDRIEYISNKIGFSVKSSTVTFYIIRIEFETVSKGRTLKC